MVLPKSLCDRDFNKFSDTASGVAVKTTEAQFEERTDVVNSQQTIFGRTVTLEAADTDAVWQIWQERTTGSETHKRFAQLSGSDNAGFVHKWSERLTLFPSPILSNPASLLFDGVDEHINLGDNYTFGPATSFSWSVWMKAQNMAAQRCMVAKISQDANVYGYSFQHNSSGKLFTQVRASGTLRTNTYTTVMSAGVWYHIVFTYAGGSNMNGLKAYIDAVAEPTPASASLNAWTVTDPLMLGKRGTSFHFSGNLNQVTVWSKELSAAEVTELYNSGTPGDPQAHSASGNLLSWWKLSDSSNFPSEIDQEGSVNGTLINMEVGDYDSGDTP